MKTSTFVAFSIVAGLTLLLGGCSEDKLPDPPVGYERGVMDLSFEGWTAIHVDGDWYDLIGTPAERMKVRSQLKPRTDKTIDFVVGPPKDEYSHNLTIKCSDISLPTRDPRPTPEERTATAKALSRWAETTAAVSTSLIGLGTAFVFMRRRIY